MDTTELLIWHNGSLVPWDKAKVHVMSYTLHYGSGVFEGIRAYPNKSGTSVFRLNDHIKRLFYSAKILGLDMPYTENEIYDAILKLVKQNKLRNSYIRPIVYLGSNLLTLRGVPHTGIAISNWDLGGYVKNNNWQKGISAKVSSYSRFSPNSAFTKAKITGNYVNTTLAIREAMRDGYDEAILLGFDGFVTEGSCENIFCVRNNVIYTPTDKNILPGLTRDSVIQIASFLGIQLVEKDISRDELYLFDEVFLAATAAEIVPVSKIDNRTVGTGYVGEITIKVAKLYSKITLGNIKEFAGWLTIVEL